jgi:hypothetical protein
MVLHNVEWEVKHMNSLKNQVAEKLSSHPDFHPE